MTVKKIMIFLLSVLVFCSSVSAMKPDEPLLGQAKSVTYGATVEIPDAATPSSHNSETHSFSICSGGMMQIYFGATIVSGVVLCINALYYFSVVNS